MKRIIKFRAWHKEEKWMGIVVGMDIPYKGTENTEVHLVTMDYSGDNWDSMPYMLGDVELMQFTGLKDKNGKEIYEGDILEHLPEKRVVKWGTYGWKPWEELEPFWLPGHCEGIGNIYENPSLTETQTKDQTKEGGTS